MFDNKHFSIQQQQNEQKIRNVFFFFIPKQSCFSFSFQLIHLGVLTEDLQAFDHFWLRKSNARIEEFPQAALYDTLFFCLSESGACPDSLTHARTHTHTHTYQKKKKSKHINRPKIRNQQNIKKRKIAVFCSG